MFIPQDFKIKFGHVSTLCLKVFKLVSISLKFGDSNDRFQGFGKFLASGGDSTLMDLYRFQ